MAAHSAPAVTVARIPQRRMTAAATGLTRPYVNVNAPNIWPICWRVSSRSAINDDAKMPRP